MTPSIRFLGAAATVTVGFRKVYCAPATRDLAGARQTLLVHGEPAALAAAQARLDRLGWPGHAPALLEEVSLS